MSMFPYIKELQRISVYLIFLHVIKATTEQQSGNLFVLSVSGHHFSNQIISEHKTASITECALNCLTQRSSCKSISFKSGQKQYPSKNCQLNNATKFTHPQNLIVNVDYNYYEPLVKEKQRDENCTYAKSCDALYKYGKRATGVYSIDPDEKGAFQVRCDMTSTPGRGWTIFQRRIDGSEDFYREWSDYKNGFGNLSGEFWLGLDKIHRLSASGQNVLRVDLESFENETRYATFETFLLGNESVDYILNIDQYTGDAGNSMATHNKMKFSTKDVDNDQTGGSNCAQLYKGAWWYNKCHSSNLNGQYLAGLHGSYADGVNWAPFKGQYYSLKTSEMKVRPTV